MSFLHVIILAIIQGLAELLPVSSSAHVIVAAKLLGEKPSSPEFTLLLLMLHTGTMFAVIIFFWRQWMKTFFASQAAFIQFAKLVIIASVLTAVVGFPIKKGIEHVLGKGVRKAEIEELFDHLNIIAPALAAAGILILMAGLRERRGTDAHQNDKPLNLPDAASMGAIQGLCLPFRGFSRSGATISIGMLRGANKVRVEAFSFAMAVVITPPLVGMELLRFLRARHDAGDTTPLTSALAPSLVGMICALLAGLVALKWLSHWLEGGRWYLFGIYCLIAAVVVQVLYMQGW